MKRLLIFPSFLFSYKDVAFFSRNLIFLDIKEINA